MIKIVKPIYELSKTDKDLVANALRFSIYSMPIFKENAKIRHFLDNPSNCSVLFVNKSVFKDVKPVIYAFEKSLRNKEKDNSNSEYRAAMGIISEYLLNKKLAEVCFFFSSLENLTISTLVISEGYMIQLLCKSLLFFSKLTK